jgi:hypothetical protein
MNTIKKLVFYFVMATIFVLVAPLTHARLGDTEEQIKVKNAGLKLNEDDFDSRAKVVVFTDFDQGVQYAVGILDGKVECETYTNVDDCKPDKEFVLNTIHSYAEVWFPVTCDKDCIAIMSADGLYFAKIGASKELRKRNVFWVFSDAWLQFAKSKLKEKANTLTL